MEKVRDAYETAGIDTVPSGAPRLEIEATKAWHAGDLKKFKLLVERIRNVYRIHWEERGRGDDPQIYKS